MSTTPSPTVDLGTALTDTLDAIIKIIDNIAQTISANASTIATVLVVGAVAYGVYKVGQRVLGNVGNWFRNFF